MRSGSALRAWVGGDDAGRVGMRADSVTVAPVPLRSALDTVVTLDIANRTWQRDALAVGVSLGVAGTAGTRRAPWHACAGATATLGRVTATLRNVHGQIHLRADARALEAIGRSAGTTPPAPPRR